MIMTINERLTLLGVEKRVKGRVFTKIKCECGTVKFVRKENVMSGITKSCGCLIKKNSKDYTKWESESPNYRHGDGTPGSRYYILYRKYSGMKQRCYNVNHNSYKNYGGRGIEICDEWIGSYQKFKEWALENGYKKGLTIDRIDNDGNYEPGNCRWVDIEVQANNKRSNLNIEIDGEVKTLAEWCKLYKTDYFLARGRYAQGKSGEELFKPLKNKPWSREDEDFLRTNIHKMSKRDIAVVLDRTLISIRSKWGYIKRKEKLEGVWTNETEKHL